MTLVDSSSWIEALRKSGDPEVRERVEALLVNGEAAWCDMVRLELWNGAAGAAERKTLRLFDQELPLLEINAAVWSLARDFALRARGAGLTLPSSDLLIFACARYHRVPIEHCDQHLKKAEAKLS